MEEVMGARELLPEGAAIAFAGVVLVALQWAAIERGRRHREWTSRQREANARRTPVIDWCVAVSAVTGWV
jgi:hypothetical protein